MDPSTSLHDPDAVGPLTLAPPHGEKMGALHTTVTAVLDRLERPWRVPYWVWMMGGRLGV